MQPPTPVLDWNNCEAPIEAAFAKAGQGNHRKETIVPKYLTIGYGDRAGYDRTPQPIRDAAHQEDAKLRGEGAVIGMAGKPVQVRNHEASGVETAEGPFMSAGLPVAGFALIEATDLKDAIRKVSGVPCAVAHGVVEVWPID